MPTWGQSQLLPTSHGCQLRCLVLLRASSQACAREAERASEHRADASWVLPRKVHSRPGVLPKTIAPSSQGAGSAAQALLPPHL